MKAMKEEGIQLYLTKPPIINRLNIETPPLVLINYTSILGSILKMTSNRFSNDSVTILCSTTTVSQYTGRSYWTYCSRTSTAIPEDGVQSDNEHRAVLKACTTTRDRGGPVLQ